MGVGKRIQQADTARRAHRHEWSVLGAKLADELGRVPSVAELVAARLKDDEPWRDPKWWSG